MSKQEPQIDHHINAHYEKYSRFSPYRIENLFFLNGITSLLGWNAILTSFDYFSDVYPNFQVALYFPFALFTGYLIILFSFNHMSKIFSYRKMVLFGILGTNLDFLLLFAVSFLGRQNQAVGFWISIVLCLFMGIVSNPVQLSFFAMINYFGEKTVSLFTVGTAASGLSITLLKVIITAIFGVNGDKVISLSVYLVITIIYNFWDLFINLKFFRSALYKAKIKSTRSEQSEGTRQLLEDRSSQSFLQQEKEYLFTLWQTWKNVNPYPFYILFTFIITISLFPNLAIQVKTSLNKQWSDILIILLYNLGDFSGKLMGDFRSSFNKHSIQFLFFARLSFFYLVCLLLKSVTVGDGLYHNNLFPYYNIYALGLTNGLVINASFIFCFESAAEQYKKFAGVLGGMVLQIGIMLGSFLAIPLEMIVSPDI